jgi:hypothetical protein
VWTFYPWPEVMSETLHHLGGRFKLVLTGRIPVGQYVRAVLDGFAGWPRLSSERQPISRRSLTYLRHVRRHGNDHGISAKCRPFPIA